ncbi:MAG: hypothetical protein ACI952_002445 [Flavobacteriales bacterium]|jgi:hypothetical protein
MTSQTIIYLFGLADRIFAIVLKVIKINQDKSRAIVITRSIMFYTSTDINHDGKNQNTNHIVI